MRCPPLRLRLGAGAYGLWEKKRAALDEELTTGRLVGADTACAGVKVRAIGS
jgi:hypothetical protein